ncbi:MAG TPA: YdeI/OmpD-associated family protein [Candidatus Udaeobacter sp.]|nr:YdeI/OmpD-associated family protein [Candidatus Udaeobacter sp.]
MRRICVATIKFFKSPKDFRRWLEKNHSSEQELWVGYHKKSSDEPSMSWPESVDQALCFGWIDGIRKSVDDSRYTIRFTPRRRGSIWSAVNIKRAQELSDKGLMSPAGIAAFKERKENRSGIYSYEQRSATLDGQYEKRLKQNKAACDFFYTQPPSYRKAMGWWIVSAKRDATRLKRLEKLITECARGKRLK